MVDVTIIVVLVVVWIMSVKAMRRLLKLRDKVNRQFRNRDHGR